MLLIVTKLKITIFAYNYISNKNNSKNNIMSIGTKIHKLMKQNNITQENLAIHLGVSQKAIHDIVSGKTQKIDFLFMNKVCEFFNVDFNFFLDAEQIFNVENNNGGAVGNYTTINTISEKLIEQYENRLLEKEERIKELKQTILDLKPKL